MNKNKFYILLITGLVISNILLVGFLVLQKRPGPRHNNPRNIVIKKLHFNESQINQYDGLIDTHKSNIRELDRKIQHLKHELYQTLVTNNADANPDSLIDQIALTFKQIEKVHYNHFNDIKQICNPSQQANFNELAGELSRIFAPKPPVKP